MWLLVRSRSFLISAGVLLLWSVILAALPLTGILGLEFCLLYGAISTLVCSHFALCAVKIRAQRAEEGPSLWWTWCQVLAAALLLQVLPLTVICLNALRITNCNMALGFAYFFWLPGIGVVFGVSIGMLIATMRRQWLAHVMIYVLPLFTVGWAVLHGLLEPPIFAYGHYFGFYPGSLYDELRSITPTLMWFRISTLALSGALLGWITILAGREGMIGEQNYGWRAPFLRRDPNALDGRLQWQSKAANIEPFLGILALTLALSAGFLALFFLRHELGTVHTNSSIQKVLGGRHETPHFILYYDENAMSPRLLEQMARDHEYRYQQLVSYFGHRPKKKIEAYLFKSTKQKEELMGAAGTMIARPWAYQFYLHGYHFPHGVLKHEMAHVFSAQFGAGPLKVSARAGVLINTALIEGVAVAADWLRGQMTPHEWSRAMLDVRRLPEPAQLLGPTGFFRYASWSAYTVAGSFSRFLIDKYGIEKYKRAYGEGAFQEVYQQSLTQLSGRWKRYLKTKVTLGKQAKRIVAYRFRRYRSIFARVCPHEIASLRHKVGQLSGMRAYPKALSLQRKICRLSPKAHNYYGFLSILYNSRQNQRAMRLARQLRKQFPAKTRPVFDAQVRTIMGRLAYRLGQISEAKAHFRAALKQRVYLSNRRSLLVYLYALEHPRQMRVIMNYLDNSRRVSALLQLQQAYLGQPGSPMLAYLLARRYYFDQHWRRATALLRIAAKGLKKLPLRAEIIRMQARCHFALGEYTYAAQRFAQLAKLPLPQGTKLQALDWKARAQWESRTYGKAPQAPQGRK